MKLIAICITLYLATLAAPVQAATIYKCLSGEGRNIAYMTDRSSACSIFILSYEAGTKEPTNADRYFPWRCWAKNGRGSAYWSDSNVRQNCNAVPKPAGTEANTANSGNTGGGTKPSIPKPPVLTPPVIIPPVVTAPSPSTPAPPSASPKGRVFAASSFWYQPIPANTPLHPKSEAFKADFLRQYKRYYNNVNINTTKWASPVYRVGKNVKPVKVGFNNCQGKTWVDPKFLNMVSAVPIPSYALPADGSDAEMTVYQQSTDTIWELWKAVKSPDGSWKACWGGKLENASQSNGQFPKFFGTTATSLPFMGGQITAEELKAGKIEHAIGISLVETDHFNFYSWPAGRSDGWNPAGLPDRIPEGLRFRLDPSIDVDRLGMSKVGTMIAKAAQTYGFIVWDKAGSISIRAENPIGYKAEGKTDPYPALFVYKPSYDVLKGMPWSKLQFMPHNYGKP